jgi:hypothetical protein
MATAKTAAIQKPLIQIDDEIREMTDEEYAEFERDIHSISTTVKTAE